MGKGGDKSKRTGGKQAAPSSQKRLKNGLSPEVGKATQFKKGQSGNPAGREPGRLNLSTHIQNWLNDENFEALVHDLRDGDRAHRGAPMKAIISVQIARALAATSRLSDRLAKYGYGTKIDVTSDGERVTIAPLVRGDIAVRRPCGD